MKQNLIRLALAMIGLTGVVHAGTTIDPANSTTYGANIGWINAEADTTNGAVIGQAFCSGYLYGANVGWIHLGNGAPGNGMAYQNDATNDFGVNHDGLGNLMGYAYGANIGWINFEQTHGKPMVNLITGNLSGYAWGANVGWISLAGLTTLTLDSGPDSDNDGLPDAWEYSHIKVLTVLAAKGVDSDGDGVSDVDEYGADTDPFDAVDYLRITEFKIDGPTHDVTWPVKASRLYTLQHVSALSNGMIWATTGDAFIPTSGPYVTKTIKDVAGPSRFYRVQSLPPLSP